MKNLKDTITTICGILIALSGAMFTMEQAGIVIPVAVKTVSGVVGALALAMLGYLTGKNPDGSTKTPEQIEAQQNVK